MSTGGQARLFLNALVAARKAMITYPPGHAMQANTLEQLRVVLADVTPPGSHVAIVAEGESLKVGDEVVPADDLMAGELLNELSERRFKGVHFEDGLEAGELGAFLRLMTRPAREIILAGGYPEAFAETGIRHIRPRMIQSAMFDADGKILVNGQSLESKMFEGLQHPELVQRLIRKLVSLQSERESDGVPNETPLEETLQNMDKIVQEQILKGVRSEDVIDTLVTPSGLQRFRMNEGSSGLEDVLNQEHDDIDEVEERALFLVELMRTMEPTERYSLMVDGFVNEVNSLIQLGTHSSLLSRLLVFMLEERRHETRQYLFNKGMENIDLKAMVGFVFTSLDRTGTFEEVILGTMLRSFGQPVAKLVMERYLSATDDWTRSVAFSALVHGSRHSLSVLTGLKPEFVQRHALALVSLAIEMHDGGEEFLSKLSTSDVPVRAKFYWALGKLNDDRSLPWLKKSLEESDAALRKTGLSQLEFLNVDHSVDLLLDFMDRWETDKIEGATVDELCLAINSLARLKSQRAIPQLQRLASQRAWFFDGDRKMIKSYARFAIQKIQS